MNLLGLQRAAGNQAVTRLIGYAPADRGHGTDSLSPNFVPLQRCGPTPCNCSDDERADAVRDSLGKIEGSVETAPGDLAIQRDLFPDDPLFGKCANYLKLIREVVEELIKRAAESVEDKFGLQWDNVSKSNPKTVIMPDGTRRKIGSVEGHKEQFESKQNRLRKLIDDWKDDDCNQTGKRVKQEDRDWSFKSFPLPAPRPRPAPDTGRRYALEIDGKRLLNVAADVAWIALQDAAEKLERQLEMAFGRHEAQDQIDKESPISSSIVKVFAWSLLPSLTIWDEPRRLLSQSRNASDPEAAARSLVAAAAAFRVAHDALFKHLDAMEGGAETAVQAGKAVAITCLVVFVVAGGVAAAPAVAAGTASAEFIASATAAVQTGLAAAPLVAGAAGAGS
jgi:hypothetical protein